MAESRLRALGFRPAHSMVSWNPACTLDTIVCAPDHIGLVRPAVGDQVVDEQGYRKDVVPLPLKVPEITCGIQAGTKECHRHRRSFTYMS